MTTAVPPRLGRLPARFRHICTLIEDQTSTKDSMGMGVWGSPVAQNTNEPCDLQTMSTQRQKVYGGERDLTLWDLRITRFRQDGTELDVNTGWRFTIAGTVYEALGRGMVQGDTGMQVVPLKEAAR